MALCVVEGVDDETLGQRSTERPARRSQELNVEQRLADYRDNIVPTLDVLAEAYPRYSLDGTLAIDANAAKLFAIYERHSQHQA